LSGKNTEACEQPTAGRARGRRAFIFSVDTLVALFVSLVLVLAAYSAMSKALPDPSDYEAQRIAAGLLASLEKSGALALAISSKSPSPFATKLASLPPSMCARLTIRSEPDGLALIAGARGCACAANRVVAKRSVAVAGASPAFYLAELEVCGK